VHGTPAYSPVRSLGWVDRRGRSATAVAGCLPDARRLGQRCGERETNRRPRGPCDERAPSEQRTWRGGGRPIVSIPRGADERAPPPSSLGRCRPRERGAHPRSV